VVVVLLPLSLSMPTAWKMNMAAMAVAGGGMFNGGGSV
jgi:hypothetical protein